MPVWLPSIRQHAIVLLLLRGGYIYLWLYFQQHQRVCKLQQIVVVLVVIAWVTCTTEIDTAEGGGAVVHNFPRIFGKYSALRGSIRRGARAVHARCGYWGCSVDPFIQSQSGGMVTPQSPAGTIYNSSPRRPSPGEVVQIPDAVRARCARGADTPPTPRLISVPEIMKGREIVLSRDFERFAVRSDTCQCRC